MKSLKQKNRYMRHQVAILEKIYEENKPSELTVHCKPDDPMFEESCKFSTMSYELYKLIETFKRMIEYNEIISEEYGDEG